MAIENKTPEEVEVEAVKIDDKEWEASEKAAKNSRSHFTVRLDTPFDWEGSTYNELVFDFGKIKMKDYMGIAHELRSRGRPIISPTFDDDFLLRAAALACTAPIGVDALEELPIDVGVQIRILVSAFFGRRGV